MTCTSDHDVAYVGRYGLASAASFVQYSGHVLGPRFWNYVTQPTLNPEQLNIVHAGVLTLDSSPSPQLHLRHLTLKGLAAMR